MIDVNDPPTAVSLVSNGIYENATAGTTVGVLRVQDQDANQTHTFAVISGQGKVVYWYPVVESYLAIPMDKKRFTRLRFEGYGIPLSPAL